MSLWSILDGGVSMAARETFGQRITLWCGHYLATRHRNISVASNCLIHPDARIAPRKGRIIIGESCAISPGAVLQGNITMGHHCSVQTYSVLIGYGDCENPAGRITIGNYVRIAPHVMMIAANHVFADTRKPISQQGLELKPITIEDDVWIAGRVNIMAGVTIGRGSVIGAGSVVTHDIPPYSIAIGVPARTIRSRKPE